MKLTSLLVALFIALCNAQAFANDSTATLGAGGLELTPNDKIQMLTEDLYISPNKVKVNYQFKNTSDQPITTLVAFPLPKLPPAEMNYSLAESNDPLNYVNFKVWVNGKVVSPQVHYKAFVEDKDVTQLLIDNNIPFNIADVDFARKIDALPKETKLKLREAGVLYFDDGYEEYPYSPWNFQVTYSWEQTFPANAITVVRHEYTPIVGSSFLHESRLGDFRKNFCMDKNTEAGITKMLKKQNQHLSDDTAPYHMTQQVDYIVKTANNWKGPIGQFKLTIDKTSPNNIVTFCGKGFKKVGPTQFQTIKNNYSPTQDLSIMVVEPPKY